MNASQKFLQEQGLWPIAELDLPSKSEKGKYHKVKLFKNGKMECDCLAGSFNRICSHQEAAWCIWEKDYGWIKL